MNYRDRNENKFELTAGGRRRPLGRSLLLSALRRLVGSSKGIQQCRRGQPGGLGLLIFGWLAMDRDRLASLDVEQLRLAVAPELDGVPHGQEFVIVGVVLSAILAIERERHHAVTLGVQGRAGHIDGLGVIGIHKNRLNRRYLVSATRAHMTRNARTTLNRNRPSLRMS